MRLVVALEGRFLQVGQTFYSPHLTFERFWKRYTNVFDSVVIISRVISGDSVPERWGVVNRESVSVAGLPQYHGPYQYLRQMWRISKIIRRTLCDEDAVILRAPGNISTQVWRRLKNGHPYGVEVMGDPWDDLALGSIRSITRPYARWNWTKNLKAQCKGAEAVAYVTEEALQKRYPSGDGAYTTYYSSIDLSPADICTDTGKRLEAISSIASRLAGKNPPVLLGFVGSFSQTHKLPHIHLAAFAKCVSQGVNLSLEMIGDGKMLADMKKLTEKLGIAGRVVFRGRIPAGKPILDSIDRFDLLLNATASEGLPRVVIEAMSRGCPCIASNVGGTPELLEPNWLVPPGNVNALSEKILSVLNNQKLMTDAVRRNVGIARNYCSDILQPRREAFYQALRQRTEQYLSGGNKNF